MMKSSKSKDSGAKDKSEEDEDSDGATIHKMVEDMGTLDRKLNKTQHSNAQLWKSVARKCPLLLLDKTNKNNLESGYQPPNGQLLKTSTHFNQPLIE